ncbi:MAG: glycosyltransferase family 4 protein [Desulfocapsa sp.]|nr:glycosyltransferase family 4 protein [Desulfocapsa sp.]
MKILHLLSQRPECTGSGVYLQNVIAQAKRAGHQNMLLAGIPVGTRPFLPCMKGHVSSFLTFSGGDLPFPVSGMSDVMPYKSSRFIDLTEEEIETYQEAFSAKIKDAVFSFQPDIIHSHHLWLMTSTARLLFPDIPMVATCHSTDLRQYLNCPHLRGKVTGACRKIDRIMALGRDQAEQIRTLYGIAAQNIHIVGGGFNDTVFVEADKPTIPPCEIVYAGKLSCAKGVPWLLRTMKRLSRLPLRLHLLGSGSGEEEKLCKTLAAELGSRVILHGRVSQQELARIMGNSHLFVLPSFYEGLPLVLLEALACGCRIISTDLPGCREIFGRSENDMLKLLPLPSLEKVDKPFERDWPRLETMLAGAITEQVKHVMDGSRPAPGVITALTAPYTWENVFSRIEAVYNAVLLNTYKSRFTVKMPD